MNYSSSLVRNGRHVIKSSSVYGRSSGYGRNYANSNQPTAIQRFSRESRLSDTLRAMQNRACIYDENINA